MDELSVSCPVCRLTVPRLTSLPTVLAVPACCLSERGAPRTTERRGRREPGADRLHRLPGEAMPELQVPGPRVRSLQNPNLLIPRLQTPGRKIPRPKTP